VQATNISRSSSSDDPPADSSGSLGVQPTSISRSSSSDDPPADSSSSLRCAGHQHLSQQQQQPREVSNRTARTSLASAAAKSPRTTPRDQEGESMCGNCGGSDCEWIRYGEALRDAALRLERRLTRRKRRNRSIRLSVCILYLYMKDGNMRGIVPACIRVGLLELWPEKKRVCIMLLVVLAPPH
jgi:hypothetical protein